jgi:hypothetical protein
MQQTELPMLRSEVQPPGFTEDEAMVPIDVSKDANLFLLP